MPHNRERKGERSRSHGKKNVIRDKHRSSPTRKSRRPTRKGSSVRSVPVTSPPAGQRQRRRRYRRRRRQQKQ